MPASAKGPRSADNSSLCHPMLSLTSALDRYMVAVECSPRYVEGLKRTVKKAKAAGLTCVSDLTADRVNRWLGTIPLASTTRHNIRRELLTLWRFAHMNGWTEEFPWRVRKIRPSYKPPVAWTMNEMRAMLDAARTDQTPISKRLRMVRRCDLLPAWIGLSYDAGVRFTDVHFVTKDQVRGAYLTTVAHKTGKPLVRHLSAATVKAVQHAAKLSPDRTLFLWALPRKRAFAMWRDFLAQHGLAGSSKWLRRTAATQVERAKTGAATEFLQHSMPHLARRHYIDQTQLDAPNAPPPIMP